MKEKVKRKLDNFFEKIVELYIYWAIIWLISYMVSTLFIKFYRENLYSFRTFRNNKTSFISWDFTTPTFA